MISGNCFYGERAHLNTEVDAGFIWADHYAHGRGSEIQSVIFLMAEKFSWDGNRKDVVFFIAAFSFKDSTWKTKELFTFYN